MFFLALLVLSSIQTAQAGQTRTKAAITWGSSQYSTPQAYVDALKAEYEAGAAQADATAGYHEKIIGIVSCAGTGWDSFVSRTVNDGPYLICIQSQPIYADGTPRYPPVTASIVGAYPNCSAPSGVWGYAQQLLVGNNIEYYCTRYTLDRQPDTCPVTPNPVAVTSGLKLQKDSDYVSSTGLNFTRNYRGDVGETFSRAKGFLQDPTTKPDTCYQGVYVSKSDANGNPLEYTPYCFPYTNPPSPPSQVILTKPDGYATTFVGAGTMPIKPANINERAELVTDANNVSTWKITLEDDSVEIYTRSGLLVSKTMRNSQLNTFMYSDVNTPITIAPKPNFLIAQTDAFGKTLQWRYNAGGQMVQMIDPAGGVFDYSYDQAGNLVTVTYPTDSSNTRKTKTYHFEHPTLRKALTGITDENGFRYATYRYNTDSTVAETKHFSASGVEVNKYTFTYPYQGLTTVVDPLGTSRSYNYTSILNYDSVTGTSQPCTSCGGNAAQANTYDDNRNITSRIDFNGNQTTYTYDLTRNLELTRTEGLTSGGAFTSASRKFITTWHPTFRLPSSVVEKKLSMNGVETSLRETALAYDMNGNMLSRTINDTATSNMRTWAYTYDTLGRVLTSTDPLNRTSTNTYYPNTLAQNNALANSRGMLASITNALGHTTTITAYNPHGQALSITDANGLTSTMTYDARQRLISRGIGSETTTYTYDGVGQLTNVTLPDNSTLNYTYDGAHRLVQIQDGLGNNMVYTLDAMGNRIKEAAGDSTGALARTRSRVYDALNRLQQDIGGATPAAQITQYAYDSNGNPTATTDPLSRTTTQAYDALNRLIQVTDPNTPTAGLTQYQYDAQDNLTQVTDPKNLATTYSYNGFNELISQSSPDTGTTTFSYDNAGNLLTKTDARNVTASYSYDALNRVTAINYSAVTNGVGTAPAETVLYTYDSCSNGKGRLCTLSDKTGLTTYSYDSRGRITDKTQALNNTNPAQTVSYRYNAAGQMDTMTLPSGKVVAYTYLNNRVTGVTYDGKAVIKNADYEPFGPIGEWTWGNDTTGSGGTLVNKHTRYFDLDGRNTKIESGNSIDPALIVYDAASRITALQRLTANTIDPAKSVSYGYDNLDRLTAVTPNLGNLAAAQSYAYDAVGNRLSNTVAPAGGNTSVTNYSYSATSHRLAALSGAITQSFSYDANGNRLSGAATGPNSSWTYGGDNRPTAIAVTNGGTPTSIQSGINALGQRVSKTVNGSGTVNTTRFIYDEAGRLIGEYDSSGKPIQETLWLNDLPVAVIK